MTTELSALAVEAARATRLDLALAQADLRIPELQARLAEAEAVARGEIADLQEVSSGLYALWLRIKGESSEAIAKEEREAKAAVAVLAMVRSELLEAVRERDGAREERGPLSDAPERFERALAAAPLREGAADLARVAGDCARATRALALAEELRRLLDRALTPLDGTGELGLNVGHGVHKSAVGIQVPSRVQVERCQENLQEVRAGVEALAEALATAGVDAAPGRETADDLSVTPGTVMQAFPLLREAIRDQRVALGERLEAVRRRRVELASEREALTRALADALLAGELS